MIKKLGASDALCAVVADTELLFVFFARFRDTLCKGMAKVATECFAIGSYCEHCGDSSIRMIDFLLPNRPRGLALRNFKIPMTSRSICGLRVQLANLQEAR